MIQGEIEGLAFGGKGILRHEGQVIFVPFTAPGDRITCRLTKKQKNYAEAELIALDQPSPLRTTPQCPYFGTCGGCQLQHIDYASQLAYKRQSVIDALTRIGKQVEVQVEAVVPAETHWAYRRHITLTLKEKRGHFEAGYLANSNSFLPVSQCPIFLPSSDPLLEQLQALVGQLKATHGNEGKVQLFKTQDNGFYLQWHFKYMPSNALETIQQALNLHDNWVGSSIATPKSLHKLGKEELILDIEGLAIQFSPRAFIQNHPEQSLQIYRLIVVQALQKRASCALDFYCGIGISSLLLARQGIRIKGVENNREAIKMARANSVRNSCKSATFVVADVQEVAEKWLETMKPDFVILNPPREGLAKRSLAALRRFPPRTILYISCMPATLARDLGQLCPDLYRLEKCQPFDMFPQTGHIETVALLNSH